jgi:excinuclease ABC subunit C
MTLQEKLQHLPDGPGVYLFKGRRGEVLYIGKALSLRKRVQSYFREAVLPSERIAAMVAQAADLDFILTENELEALILESNLIKERRPKYNIVLKDDKHYPFLKINVKEPFPRVEVARRIKDDGAVYFGPYVPAGTMWKVLSLINRTFPYRRCPDIKGRTLCLEYHLGRCLGPCEGLVTREEYAELIAKIRLLLEGKDRELLGLLERQMEGAAEQLAFERAAKLRDMLLSLRHALETQRMISPGGEDRDVFGLAQGGTEAQVQLLIIRGGKVIGRDAFTIAGGAGEDPGATLAALAKQFYLTRQNVPRQVLVSHLPEDAALIAEWLSGRAGRRVEVAAPQRGKAGDLVAMAVRNAEEALALSLRSSETRRLAMEELKAALGLRRLPRRIEAYDISNISGTLAVGSLVAWEDAQPHKAGYKRFRIQTVPGADDYAMLREVLTRRFARAETLPLPDLFLIDGGRGQLGVGLQTAREAQRTRQEARGPSQEEGAGRDRQDERGEAGREVLSPADADMVALAKEEELVFLPGRPEPVRLPDGSRAKHLLQQIRDEAHRFANTYHRHLRGKANLRSILDEIPGIGERRKKALLDHFGSLRRLREAEAGAIRQVAGIPAPLAQSIHDFLAGLTN